MDMMNNSYQVFESNNEPQYVSASTTTGFQTIESFSTLKPAVIILLITTE